MEVSRLILANGPRFNDGVFFWRLLVHIRGLPYTFVFGYHVHAFNHFGKHAATLQAAPEKFRNRYQPR